MSSTGAKSLITDNLVINNVFAVQDDGTPAIPGKVLVTTSSGQMAYQSYDGGEVWYTVPAATNVDMSGNSIIRCPNMVSEITSTGGTNNCINITPNPPINGNISYNITTNITTQPSSGIQIQSISGGGIELSNTDKGSNWSSNQATQGVNFAGNQLNNVGTITSSSGTIDLSGVLINSGGNFVINDTLDLSGNSIQGVNSLTASGIIQGGTVTATNVNFTGNLQQNGTNINVVQSVANGGPGITITGGTGANPTISTSLIAGDNITIDVSGNSLVLDVNGGGASQWDTCGNNISYTGGNVGINNITPIAPLDIDSGSNNSGGQYFTEPGKYYITIPDNTTTMYYEIIGAGGDTSGNGAYANGTFNVSTYWGVSLNIIVNSSGNYFSDIELQDNYVIAYNGSGNPPSTNGTYANSGFTINYGLNGSQLPSYLLPDYGRPGKPGFVYISFDQPSIRAVGDIISGGSIISNSINSYGSIIGGSLDVSGGSISGGAITGSSLNVSSGSITGGSVSASSVSGGVITGTSLNVSGNTDISGFIYTHTTLLANVLYSYDTSGARISLLPPSTAPTSSTFSITILQLIQASNPSYPFTSSSNYVRVSIFAVGGGGSGSSGGSSSGGGGGGSGQEVNQTYYIPVTTTLTLSIPSNASPGYGGGQTTILSDNNYINIKCWGGASNDGGGLDGNYGQYGGGGGASSNSGGPGVGGVSYASPYYLNYQRNIGFYSGGSNGGANAGGNGDGPNNDGGKGDTSAGEGYGGGGGGTSTLGNGGNGGLDTYATQGYHGAGGGGGTGGSSIGSGTKGGSGAVWIQIFSV